MNNLLKFKRVNIKTNYHIDMLHAVKITDVSTRFFHNNISSIFFNAGSIANMISLTILLGFFYAKLILIFYNLKSDLERWKN